MSAEQITRNLPEHNPLKLVRGELMHIFIRDQYVGTARVTYYDARDNHVSINLKQIDARKDREIDEGKE